ncbi:metallophosphoesterase [Gemmata palustris]|nr:metallophosphoesterase [Gemmata palustris]
MPAPDRMLTHLRQAVALVRATPGRRGHTVALEGCTEVLVAGDLHGHVAHFQTMLKYADLANHPTRHFVLQEIIHGKFRYPKGGDKSHQLVDLFSALKGQFPKQVHYLPGNHELAQWTNRPVIKADENQNALFQEGVSEAYGPAFGPKIYAAYLELFQALPVALRAPNGVLISHSLPAARFLPLFDPARLDREAYQDEDLQPGGSVHSLLWGRDTSADAVANFLRKMGCDLLVSGHIASDTGFAAPNDRQLILDCAETPAGFVLFPADRKLTHAELVGCVKTI